MDGMLKFFAGKFVQTCAEVALVASIFLPYVAFFVLTVCAAALTLGWHYLERNMPFWALSMSGVAVVFNPVFPFSFYRGQWFWIDLFSVLFFLLAPRVREFARQR